MHLNYYITPKYLISQLIRSIFVYGNFRVFKAGFKLLSEQKEETVFAKK
jgi:predicted deacetylase